jgi:hypothetical protein
MMKRKLNLVVVRIGFRPRGIYQLNVAMRDPAVRVNGTYRTESTYCGE